jgi:hypothetical protein
MDGLSAAVAAIPTYGQIAALVIQAFKLLFQLIGSAGGPLPQDSTLEDAQSYGYRGFSSFVFRTEDGLNARMAKAGNAVAAEVRKAQSLARFVQLIDDSLARLSGTVGIDLLCVFPSRADRADYTLEDLAQIREVADARPEQLVYFLLDKEPPRYILPTKIEGVAPGGMAPTGTTAPAEAPPAGSPAAAPTGTAPAEAPPAGSPAGEEQAKGSDAEPSREAALGRSASPRRLALMVGAGALGVAVLALVVYVSRRR